MPEKQENKYAKIIMYASMIMSLFYLMMGLMLIFTNLFNLEETNKLILGIALIGYAIYRFYRILKKVQSEKVQE